MTPLPKFLLPFCIAFALPVFGHCQALELSVKAATIEIDSGMISLSDIASVYSTNRNVVNQVGGLDLDEIMIGQSIEIQKKQIRMRIRLANLNFDSITIRGPEKIVVKRVQPGNKLAKVKSLIIESVVNQFGIDKENVQVDINESSLAKIRWDNHRIERSTVVLPTELPLGKTKVRLVYDDNSKNDLELIVDCRISVLTQMLVATRNLERGVSIASDDFKMVKRPLSNRQIVPASKLDLVGKETNTVIPVHGIIRLSNLAKAAKRNLVKRNDVVDIVFTRGALKLRVKNAKVLTAGAKGDRVEVLNPTSQRPLVASVVSESLVEIR